MNKTSKTFCVLPWIHLSTRPNGHLRLCCTACASSAGPKKKGSHLGYLKNESGVPANLNNTSLSEAWNNDYMKSVRRAMLAGEIPASCMKCFKEEGSGFKSKRVWETEYWSKKIDINRLIKNTKEDGSVPPEIYYVDLRLGSKCDLKCIMCSPHDSSLWIPDWLELYPEIESEKLKKIMIWENYGKKDGASYDWYKNNEVFWKELYEQIPHIRQLYFAGGESIIIEEHYKLLEKCIKDGNAQDIELRYNSNGLNMPERLFELWSHFKKVRFNFSLDGVGEHNYYIRYPSNWKLVLKNLERLDNTPDNIEVTLACAVQVFNIYYLPDFIKWKLSMNYKKINPWPHGAGLINFHFVYHPAHLNVKVLPLWFKKETKEKFDDFYEWLLRGYGNNEEFIKHEYGIKRLNAMIDFMMSEDWSSLLPELKEYILKMDKIRGLDFQKTFSEMKNIFKTK